MARLLFDEAREIIASLGLRNQKDFYDLPKEGRRPPGIPSNPREAYRSEWLGWAYWLGTGPAEQSSRPTAQVPFLGFEEARELARSLGFENQTRWYDWVRRDDKPVNIPADPSKAYKGRGWAGWPDWLGKKPARASGNEDVLPFHEARLFSRGLGLKGYRAWWAYADSPERPANVPKSPESRYADEGWIGWGDWLGHHTRWNHMSIVAFLRELTPVLDQLQPIELYLILQQNGMLRLDRRNLNAAAIVGIRKLCSAENSGVELEHISAVLEEAQGDGEGDEDSGWPGSEEMERENNSEGGDGPLGRPDRPGSSNKGSEQGSTGKDDDPDGFRWMKNRNSLKAVDALADSYLVDDTEILDFLVENRVAGLWQKVIASEMDAAGGIASGREFDPEEIRSQAGGVHFGQIKTKFFDQYDRVKSLGLPEGYDFRKDGQIAEPNLMQRLVAYRLLTEKRSGHWSGVGSGKTISAVYSAGILKAGLTVVVAANATVVTAKQKPGDWERVVRSVFPDALVFTKKRAAEIRVEAGRPTFFITNYESFQQEWSKEFVADLAGRFATDLIVLDEVQSVRRRSEGGDPSDRRQFVQQLIDLAARRNPDLRLLAMSATPVVNNLVEAKTLLEMLTGSDFAEMRTGTSIPNAVRAHQLLTRHGIRFKPHYDQRIETSYPILDGVPSLPFLSGVKPGNVLQLEQATLQTKLPHLAGWLGAKGRSRTMIYTHFVREIVDRVANAVRAAGYSVGLYTGKSKEGLEAFLRERDPVDVLIGSAPLGTGVDGLQFVCNRLIFLSLPWSNAEYEQIVGRLWRQGSEFEKVEVIIPQVVLRRQEAGYWSWDDERARCVQYKKTLADAVLDGVIPEGDLPSREERQRRSLRALHDWIGRVSKGDPEIETEP